MPQHVERVAKSATPVRKATAANDLQHSAIVKRERNPFLWLEVNMLMLNSKRLRHLVTHSVFDLLVPETGCAHFFSDPSDPMLRARAVQFGLKCGHLRTIRSRYRALKRVRSADDEERCVHGEL
jgi:hypothetical protein